MYAKWNKNSGGGSTTTYFYFAIEKVDEIGRAHV